MSNINRTDVLAWGATVNGMAAELSRPIENTSDLRYVALVEKFGANVVAGLDYDELGASYFKHLGADMLPGLPIAPPEWAENHVLTLDDYPNAISVEFQGKKWDTGSGDPDVEGPEAWAQAVQTFDLVLRDHEVGGYSFKEGAVITDGMVIEFSYLEPKNAWRAGTPVTASVTFGSAHALKIALADVLDGLPFD